MNWPYIKTRTNRSIRRAARDAREDRFSIKPQPPTTPPGFGLEPLEPRLLLSGVTIITHGAAQSSPLPVWVTALRDEIAVRAPSELGFTNEVAPVATITVTDDGGGGMLLSTTPFSYNPLDSESGELVLALDWSDVASPGVQTTQAVAAFVANAITGLGIFSNLSTPLLELPIHLIGHSRGASLVGALAEDLGEAGAWVDQVTFLDSHPIAIPEDWGDSGMVVPGNVIFADSYWRADGINIFEPLDFDGEPVAGAHDVEFDESVLGGFTDPAYTEEHSDVHLWYQGTVDTVGPISDGVINNFNPDGFNWYAGNDASGDSRGPRSQTGYYYSRAGGGSDQRPSDGLARQGATRSPFLINASGGNVWDNIELIGLSADQSVIQGSPLSVDAYYADLNTDATITIGFDLDANPYNQNFAGSVASGQTMNLPPGTAVSALLSTASLTIGDTYNVYAEISNGINTRFYYAVGKFTIVGDDHGNDASNATPVGVNSSIAGDIEVLELDDVDWFSFQAQTGYGYTFQTVLNGLTDSVLTLYDQDGTTVIAFNNDAPGIGLASRIDWTAPSPGTYYIEVSGFSSNTGTYSLNITETPPIQGDLNLDGFVGIADLNIILGVWNQNVAPGDLLAGDPSGDGFVGIDDLNTVLGNWNAGTPPMTVVIVERPASLDATIVADRREPTGRDEAEPIAAIHTATTPRRTGNTRGTAVASDSILDRPGNGQRPDRNLGHDTRTGLAAWTQRQGRLVHSESADQGYVPWSLRLDESQTSLGLWDEAPTA